MFKYSNNPFKLGLVIWLYKTKRLFIEYSKNLEAQKLNQKARQWITGSLRTTLYKELRDTVCFSVKISLRSMNMLYIKVI